MSVKITSPGNKIQGQVQVPLSKSESNRIIFIKALSGFDFNSDTLSDAADTVFLKQQIQSTQSTLQAGDGAATARFLIGYCVARQRKAVITGSESLCNRPMNDTVNALRQLGASINYIEKENFLPVEVLPAALKPVKELFVSASRSSQHISTLMMMMPVLKSEMTIHLTDTPSSLPYIQLTAHIMRMFGADVIVHNNKVITGATPYKNADVTSGGDWSAASYFYEIAALSDCAEIEILHLDKKSIQGDSRLIELMKAFAVETKFADNKIIINKTRAAGITYFTDNFIHTPDLALTVAATCGGLNITADLRGLQNLSIKESDRVASFQREAYKLNIKTDFCDYSKLKILEESDIKPTSKKLKTYNDHRMAMCLAPLSVCTGSILLDNADVVNKSFPGYWENLNHLGFSTSFNQE